tara:strand:+ start:32 stop:280 length:249 start_codon:yes stop_codon:yes gene_type:complete
MNIKQREVSIVTTTTKQNEAFYYTRTLTHTYIQNDMNKPSIKCSRCNETFNGGMEYRMHFYKHLDEWLESEDKIEYIKRTTL